MTNAGSTFDAGVLEDVTCHALQRLADSPALELELGLVDAKPPPAKLRNTLLQMLGSDELYSYSQKCRFSKWGTCCVDDVVVWREGSQWKAGRVAFHVSRQAETLTGLVAWELMHWSPTFSTWRALGTAVLIDSFRIHEVCIYSSDDSAGLATVFHPLSVR